jgi:hypothetical protein
VHPIRDNFNALDIQGRGTHIMILAIQKCLQTHIPKIFLESLEELEIEAQKGIFTSWSLSNNEAALSAFWADECQLNIKKNSENIDFSYHPTFDLSSLTKPIFLNFYLRELFKQDYIKIINTPINDLFLNKNILEENEKLFQYILNSKNNFCLNSFLSHYSGAKNWFWMGSAKWFQFSTSHNTDPNIYHTNLDVNDKNYLHNFKSNLNSSCIKSLNNNDYGNYIYSDVNYYILSRMIESFFMRDKNWIQIVDLINDKLESNFFHSSLSPQKSKNSIPYYPYISYYNDDINIDKLKELNFGFVNDTNSNILSSMSENNNLVSGHSGFFGNIIDVTKATKEIISSQTKFLNEVNYESNANVRFVFGLDTPSSKESTAGLKNWPENRSKVYGHLGYTGTSFWFQTNEKKHNSKYHVLLTNRISQRRKYGVEKCPRIFIYSDFINKNNKYFRVISDEIKEINNIELNDILNEFFGISNKIWDSSVVRIAPNINNIRKSIAKKMWNI